MNDLHAARAPGDLDPDFGGRGVILLPQGFSPIAVPLSDDKLMVVGRLDNDVALLRLNADGTTDSSFGDAGVKRVHTLDDGATGVWRMAVFPDDSLVLLGDADSLHAYLLRTLPSGELDPQFGDGGVSLLTLPGIRNLVTALTAQPDGKVLLAVQATLDFFTFNTWLVRLDQGRPDPAFGAHDTGLTLIGRDYSVSDIAVLPDGHLFMVGALNAGYVLVQCDDSGRFDKAFGENGFVYDWSGYGARPFKAVPQPDGKIALVGDGTVDGELCNMALRVLPNGAPDPTFNQGIPFYSPFADATSQNVTAVLQPDGKLVAAGGTLGTSQTSQLVVMRFNPDTGLDDSFGDQGRVTTQLGGFDLIRQLYLQRDGKIIAVGSSLQSIANMSVIARYLP